MGWAIQGANVQRQLKKTCRCLEEPQDICDTWFPQNVTFMYFDMLIPLRGKKKSMVLFYKIGIDSEYSFPTPLYEVFF